MNNPIQTHEDAILTALSVHESGFEYSPVHVQKIMFLLDDNAKDELGISGMFTFVPYNFGPFDRNIYSALQESEKHGTVRIIPGDRRIGYQRFALTEKGRNLGQELLKQFPDNVSKYVRDVAEWVTECTFQELIQSIYTAYPHMQENSVFSRPIADERQVG